MCSSNCLILFLYSINSLYEKNGAGNGAQTRDLCLGKAALYQLSYSRIRIRTINIIAKKNQKVNTLRRLFVHFFILFIIKNNLSDSFKVVTATPLF